MTSFSFLLTKWILFGAGKKVCTAGIKEFAITVNFPFFPLELLVGKFVLDGCLEGCNDLLTTGAFVDMILELGSAETFDGFEVG